MVLLVVVVAVVLGERGYDSTASNQVMGVWSPRPALRRTHGRRVLGSHHPLDRSAPSYDPQCSYPRTPPLLQPTATTSQLTCFLWFYESAQAQSSLVSTALSRSFFYLEISPNRHLRSISHIFFTLFPLLQLSTASLDRKTV